MAAALIAALRMLAPPTSCAVAEHKRGRSTLQANASCFQTLTTIRSFPLWHFLWHRPLTFKTLFKQVKRFVYNPSCGGTLSGRVMQFLPTGVPSLEAAARRNLIEVVPPSHYPPFPPSHPPQPPSPPH